MSPEPIASLMKRTALAGILTLLAGAFTLLLLASIFYSCRSGGDPHHPRSSATLPSSPAQETRGPTHAVRDAGNASLAPALDLSSSSERSL